MEMVMKRRIFSVAVAVFFVAMGLSGCTKKAVRTDVGVGLTEKQAEVVKAEPVKGETPAEQAVVDKSPEQKVTGLTDIFFDFDRYSVRDDGVKALDTDAKLLTSKKDMRVVIEGHCDERGTDEYNIALGDKRAEAVKRYLTTRGVEASRMKVVSYGNERPFCGNHDEECWQSNRRAHFVAN
ncbi:MAG: peptidoglycan-associated lipoprotein Pal [Deltaproteobacteria bacterium]|nr:peptidoglycan-associated lipoprotein Pal [Deltaproteobacteria bacterium]